MVARQKHREKHKEMDTVTGREKIQRQDYKQLN